MESTIVKTVARTANLRHWLCRPDCPEAIKQLKVLLDQCFVPANATSESKEFTPIKGSHRAHIKHDGLNFSRASTHAGNASIIYRPSASEAPVAGQIQWIKSVKTPNGPDVIVHVRLYEWLSRSLYDPFLRYPHFHATTYSSTLQEKQDVIELDNIIAHAAHFDYSQGRSVLVNLSRQ